jgi:hypothetical protein
LLDILRAWICLDRLRAVPGSCRVVFGSRESRRLLGETPLRQ